MHIIIDSALSNDEALKQNPDSLCPTEILKRQRVVSVFYYSFDGKLHQGQIVINKDLVKDIKDFFELAQKMRFPIGSVVPIDYLKFHWDDHVSVRANNTSGFNYRRVYHTGRLSNHATGRAIDINPKLNPYLGEANKSMEGFRYNLSKPGTLAAGDEIVSFFKSRGWEWGGDRSERIDYQHFQKLEV